MGYSRGGIYNGKKTIIPNEKAPLIKQLFEEYATGLYSQKELIQRFKPKGLNLSKSNLSVLLDNILYAGFIDLKKHKIEPFTLIKGVHKPIISEKLFYKVQKIKTGRNRMVKKVRPKNEKFPLSAFMLCSCCGKPMYGATSNNGKNKKIHRYYDYYGCKNRCKNQSFDAKLVHSEFQKELSAIKPSKGIVALFKQEEKETALAEREAAIVEREAELQSAAPVSQQSVPGEKFTFNGEKYQFTDEAPKFIRIDGVARSQKEIIKDEDALLQLVAGNSSLIQKI